MPVNASIEEPTIPPRLQRVLAAAWISLGLHAALIALVQVVPPASLSLSAPAIEARLVSAPVAPPAAETPPAPEVKVPEKPPKAVPLLAPSETPEALPVAEPPAPPPAEPEPPAAEAPPAAADPRPAPVAASPAVPAPVATITSSVDLTFYTARDLDVQPRALREIVPDYPSDADRRRLSGKVRLQLKLEADGRVSDIGIVSASPPGIFDESAIKAFREARFAPAQKGGRPVRALVVIEVVYDWEGRR